jgi:hypothetical protein
MEPLFPWLRLSRTANAPLHCLERCATIPSGQTWVGADCSPMLIEEPVISNGRPTVFESEPLYLVLASPISHDD